MMRLSAQLATSGSAPRPPEAILAAPADDLYPEYTGVITTELAKITERPKSAEQTYNLAKGWEDKRGFTLLEKTPFSNATRVAVLPAYAQENGLETVGDLEKMPHWSYGAPAADKTRYQGVVGLEQAYGLHNFTFVPLSVGLQYNALDSNKVEAAAVFSTDGQLKGGKYTVLTDTKGIFGYQNVAPVVNTKLLAKERPAFVQTLNAVSSKLTNEAMQTMNAAVQLDKRTPA